MWREREEHARSASRWKIIVGRYVGARQSHLKCHSDLNLRPMLAPLEISSTAPSVAPQCMGGSR